MKLFFDLDGTLIDARPRLFHLFQSLVPESKLGFDEYWVLKRQQMDHDIILKKYFHYSAEQIAAFKTAWMKNIEAPDWLLYDKPFEGVTELLRRLSTSFDLYIVTARQFKKGAIEQIETFGWNKLVKGIFVTCQEAEKHDLILKNITPDNSDWFIGDTGKDIQTGKILGMRTAAVLSGFRNKESLEKYSPDVIKDSVLNLIF